MTTITVKGPLWGAVGRVGKTDIMDNQCGLYVFWELYFQVNLLTLWANAREKWVTPIAAAKTHRVQETELATDVPEQPGAWGTMWANPLAFTWGCRGPAQSKNLLKFAQGDSW